MNIRLLSMSFVLVFQNYPIRTHNLYNGYIVLIGCFLTTSMKIIHTLKFDEQKPDISNLSLSVIEDQNYMSLIQKLMLKMYSFSVGDFNQ